MGSGVPTFAIPTGSFMDVASDSFNETVATIVGIPYDLGTSNRPGTRFGPEAIRRASRMLVDGGHPYHRVNPRDLVLDAGNLPIVQGDMMGTLLAIREAAAAYPHLISLGGDHSITLPLLQALHEKHGPLGLLHFDAHLDTWSDNFGGIGYGHGNPFYHAIEQGLIDTKRMVQVGIRSPVDRVTADWTSRKGSTILTALDVHMASSFYHICQRIEDILGAGPSYLTVDIDVLDPAFAPGTGTPEIGGLTTWQLQALLRSIRRPVNFVGMDVVEVSPPYDHAEITALAAATMVWEYICRLAVIQDR